MSRCGCEDAPCCGCGDDRLSPEWEQPEVEWDTEGDGEWEAA